MPVGDFISERNTMRFVRFPVFLYFGGVIDLLSFVSFRVTVSFICFSFCFSLCFLFSKSFVLPAFITRSAQNIAHIMSPSHSCCKTVFQAHTVISFL